MESAVVSVTAVNGGDAHNVIPESVAIKGTVRSLTMEGLRRLQTRVSEICDLVGQANGCEVMLSSLVTITLLLTMILKLGISPRASLNLSLVKKMSTN